MSQNKDSVDKKAMNLKLQKRLATYSSAANLAVLSGLALSGIAHANPVRIDVNPDFVLNTPGLANGFGIDFDQDMSDEFTVVFTNAFGNAIYLDRVTTALDSGQSVVGYTAGGFFYAKALDGSISVGPTRTDFVQNAIFYLGFGTNGQFPGAGDKYVGVKFQLDGANTHYGWILLDVAPDSSSVTIRAYGYDDTPDTGIPTAVTLQSMTADTAVPWWRAAAIAATSVLTAISLWWRRRVGREAS